MADRPVGAVIGRSWLCALLLVFSACGAAAEPFEFASAESAVRQEFKAAMLRVRQASPEPPDSSALQAYVIYDYLVAARLRRDLEQKAGEEVDAAIDDFLRKHTGEPVARNLRHEWLVSLAERQRWDLFMSRSADTDPQTICFRLAGRLARGELAGLGDLVIARWTIPQKQPDACNGVFAWARMHGLLTPELAAGRVRGALAADNARLAREFLTDVPADRAASLLQWVQLLEAPNPMLRLLAADPGMTVDADALLAGFTRLSVSHSADAREVLPGLLVRPDMTPALQGKLARAAALGAAYDRDSHAVPAFSALTAEPADVPVQEWRVRAALWAGDYAQALTWILQMPPSLASQPRWRYWRARALGATAGAAAAAGGFADLAGLRDYYGYLAADQVHANYSLHVRPSTDDAIVQAALAREPGLIRAHTLFDCEMTDDAITEWAAVVGNSTPAVKLQAARMASRWGWYAQTIATLAQAGEWDDVPLRYPRPYATAIADAAKFTQIPDDWILAVMRQESLFRVDAVSRADALGLMQMQPATAAAVARRWHLPAPGRNLFDPSVAVKLGAAHLRELLDRYGQLDLALAAYNAGPVSVGRWLPPQPVDADIWIENIPYAETRAYVQHIVEHIVAFAAMRGAEPPRLSALLPPIKPVPKGAPSD